MKVLQFFAELFFWIIINIELGPKLIKYMIYPVYFLMKVYIVIYGNWKFYHSN